MIPQILGISYVFGKKRLNLDDNKLENIGLLRE